MFSHFLQISKEMCTHTALSVTKAFPMPYSFFTRSVGLSITDTGIRIAGLSYEREGKPKISFLDEIRFSEGVFEDGVIKNHKTILHALSRLREEYHFDSVHLALPEEHAYVFEISLPLDTHKNMRSAIEFRMKEYVPLSLEQIVFDYDIMEQKESEIILQVVAYPSSVVNEYTSLLESVGCVLSSVESSGQSLLRACGNEEKGPVAFLFMDSGPASIVVGINDFVYSSTILDVSSSMIHQSLKQKMQWSENDTKFFLEKKGITFSKEKESVFLRSLVDVYAQALSEKKSYWKIGSVSNKDMPDPRIVYVSGAYSSVRGLPEYIASKIDMPVLSASVWENISFDTDIPPLSKEKSALYAVPLGLALRHFFPLYKNI
jgi:Tfp pilus assembly PilM family ATPase